MNLNIEWFSSSSSFSSEIWLEYCIYLMLTITLVIVCLAKILVYTTSHWSIDRLGFSFYIILRMKQVFSTIKTSCHNKTKVLLKVVFNTNNPIIGIFRGVTIHFFHKRYISRYLICITIRIMMRFIGN